MQLLLSTLLLYTTSSVAQRIPSLQDAIPTIPNIGTFGQLVTSNAAVSSLLSQQSNITILAPSNDAITRFLQTDEGRRFQQEPAYATAVLSYHVLKSTLAAADFIRLSAARNGEIAGDSFLEAGAFANVAGGQNVGVDVVGGNVVCFSGLLRNSTVTGPDNRFQGGILHVIDTVLTVPPSISTTGTFAGLTSLLEALTTADIASDVEALSSITVFAPTNQAFANIASATASLDAEDLAGILEYHMVDGVVLSTDITNGQTVTTRAGATITFTVSGSNIFVNGVQVVLPNVFVANGIVHTIDNVLNPSNSTVRPAPGATQGEIQFSPASAGNDPHPSPPATYVPVPPAATTTTTTPCSDEATTPSSTVAAVTTSAPLTSSSTLTLTRSLTSSLTSTVRANSTTTIVTRPSGTIAPVTTRPVNQTASSTRAPVVSFTGAAVPGPATGWESPSLMGAVVAVVMAALL
ncbi:FAS1 domain-containing protein [Elsinoe ampelina]|uniref:FAS1 domain-containing protein n=1 Tax=Elsinoe ampelina TaxID=302913 RepID=A0A6A6G837_9PEZI|nr:FAS1 domain-containing protein [Elsinoe ampelina]